MGLRTVPSDDTGLSVSKAVYGSPLIVTGEFLSSLELPLSTYLSRIEQAVAGLAIPPYHHVPQSPPHQLPAALLSAKYMFFQGEFVFSCLLLCLLAGTLTVPSKIEEFAPPSLRLSF